MWLFIERELARARASAGMSYIVLYIFNLFFKSNLITFYVKLSNKITILSIIMSQGFDYTLKINFEDCTAPELHYILQVLYDSSLACIEDIIELANETIYRINEIGYDITDKKYHLLNQFVHSLNNVLIILKIEKQQMILKKNYNEFIKNTKPKLEDMSGCGEIYVPKIMKKPLKKLLNHMKCKESLVMDSL